LTERILDPGPLYNRLALWATAANMVLHNPLLGVGFGRTSFAEHAPDYLTNFGEVDASWAIGVGVPHNEFLHIGTLLALPAVLLFAALLWYCTKTLVSGSSGKEPRELRAGRSRLCVGDIGNLRVQ
jgi:O-antigen ligase